MGSLQTIPPSGAARGREQAAEASLLAGAPLPEPGPVNLAEALQRAARRRSGPAICHIGADGTESWSSYAELLRQASRVLGGIRRAGVRPGEGVLLRLGDERELLTAFWACVLGGFVPAPIGSRDGLEQAWHALHRPWIIADDATGARLAGPAEGPRAHWIGAVDRLGSAARPVDTAPAPSQWHDIAVLVLTAGSTANPKAVMLSHGNILSRSTGTALANGVSEDCVTFNWMPLDHVSGLVMFHVRDVFAAATQIHAHKQWVLADPLRWLDVIDRHRVNAIWAANSAFDLVSSRVEAEPGRRWDLSCVVYVMNGGAPVKARTIRRFMANLAPHGLPATAMRPGWGMSETSSGIVDHRLDAAVLDENERFVPVGVPHPGVAVRVVGEDDRVVPAGTLGHLQVGGPTVTCGYFGAEDLTRRAFTADGWFRTGDMAFVEDGALTVTGSADDLIRQGESVCHGHEIESLVEDVEGIAASSAVACTVAGGELAVFCALVDGTDADRAAWLVRAAIGARFGMDVAHVVPIDPRDVPRTPTGKPKRAQLRALFSLPGALDRPRPAVFNEEHTPPCS
ncbi:AMP-binding protein [Streptomyces sp. UG1]|uniref:AMP-binding protein n=1 Tax=Streptomyces sp. UG1 TaxID=3417652 RepID=UPI003CF88E0E